MTAPSVLVRRLSAALWGCAALLFAAALATAPWRVYLNYNEGWMALFADRAMRGQGLYPPPGAWISNNYPPLSFYLVGGLGRLIGDTIVAGRLLNLVSIAATAGGVWWSARRLDASQRWAATAALVFVMVALTFFHTYAGIADLQWTAQALSLAGLPLLLGEREGRLGLARVALACLAMAAAGFIKHNLVALPLAATLWLAWHDRRALGIWVVAGAAAVGGGLLLIQTGFGPDAFADIFRNHRRMLLDQAPDALVYLIPLLTAAWALWRLARVSWADRRVRLIVLFAGVAAPLAVIQRLGEGVNVNAYFELLAALSIGAGVALARTGGPRLALAVLAPLGVAAPVFLAIAGVNLAALPASIAGWRAVIGEVAQAPGPVACETLSVCYWAGKGFELDFFNYGQALHDGVSPAGLVEALNARRFARIVLVRDADFAAGRGRLPQPIPAAIEATYQDMITGPRHVVVMRPRR